MCVLPSGRILTYRGLRFERVAELDDDDKVVGYSTQLRFSRGHGRVKLWHGLACENVVQATAADVLRGTLRRLDGFDVRLHTHDDIVLEADEDDAERVAYELREIMQHGFPWSEGLPLLSEETIAPYYTKWRES
jgi:DNA polymerase